MKTLSIQQPWASIIIAGIKDVENRTWDTKYRGKLLIHASSKKVPQNIMEKMPIEWENEITNAVWMGIMPDFPDMPTSAIIGYVDLADSRNGDTGSIWDQGDDLYKFVMENVYEFDEPITGVNGKLGLWEYDLDENNLPPAHKAEPPTAKLEGKELFVKLEKSYFDSCIESGIVSLATSVAIDETLLDTNTGNTKVVETLTIALSDGTIRRFNLPDGVVACTITDAEGNPIMVPSLFAKNPEKELQIYDFKLGKEL